MAVDWSKVEAARRRGKLGRMLPGDQELCDAAWKQDPERYKKLSRYVVESVTEEMRALGRKL